MNRASWNVQQKNVQKKLFGYEVLMYFINKKDEARLIGVVFGTTFMGVLLIPDSKRYGVQIGSLSFFVEPYTLEGYIRKNHDVQVLFSLSI